MTPQEEASLLRHKDFLDKAIQSGRVWGLKHPKRGWVFGWSDRKGKDPVEVLPFWGSKAAADRCSYDEWKAFRPTSIPLRDFVSRWLPGMKRDGVLVGTNWNAKLIGYECTPKELKEQVEALAEDPELDVLAEMFKEEE